MTETSETPETPDLAPELPALDTSDRIRRCACGVRAGRAHYCAEQDHNWIKAPEPPALED